MAYYGRDYGRWAEPRDRARGSWWWGEPARRYSARGYPQDWGDSGRLRWSRPELNASYGNREFGRGAGPAESRWTGDERAQSTRSSQSGSFQGRGFGGRTTTARDLMTQNPEMVTGDATLAEVARKMRDLDVGIIPVVEDLDNSILTGVITDRDIAVRAAAEGEDMSKAKARDFMSDDVETVFDGSSVGDVFAVMKRRQVRRVPVTDANRRLVGIIAQADLAVDYAGLDLERELEVEEVLERISEPARPERGRGRDFGPSWEADRHRRAWAEAYDRDLADRLREGWQTIKREARHVVNRGYDRRFF